MAESNKVDDLTKASIDRLRLVNKIRDVLYDNTDYLTSFGIKKAFLFGSTMKGTAEEIEGKKHSDIDICMAYEKKGKPIKKGDNAGLVVYNGMLEDVFGRFIVEKLVLTEDDPEVLIDLNFCNIDVEEVDSESRPKYAKDGIVIWESKKTTS